MKRTVKWIAMLAALATMLMCASACGENKDTQPQEEVATNQISNGTQIVDEEPTTGEVIGDWEDTQTGQTTEATQTTQGSATTEATQTSQGNAATEATTKPAQGNQGTETTTKPTQGTQATDPTMSEGVENWTDTQATQPATKPTTQPTTKPTTQATTQATTKPAQATTQATTKPAQSTTQSGNQTTESPMPPENDLLTYEEYNKLSVSEKEAYFKSFADPEDFYDWLDAAEAVYNEQNKDNVVTGDGSIDLEDFIKNHTKGDS